MTITIKERKNKKLRSERVQDMVCYLTLIAWPVLQFVIFYFAMNINSFALAFERYDMTQGYVWNGLKTIDLMFGKLISEPMFVDMFVNSFFIWGFSLTVGLFLGLIVAYYIYKKCAGSGFFKVILFAPCVISGTVMITIFKQLADAGFPALAEAITGKYVVGLLTNPDSAFLTILIYNIWFGLGGNMLLYLGSMEQINESVIESAKLEGVGFLREFFCITLPSIYPTFVTFVTVGVSGFFSNNMSLYLFYGLEADSSLMNIGYYLFVSVLNAGYDNYTQLSAMGLFFTAIVIPLTFLVRWLMTKFGPSTE